MMTFIPPRLRKPAGIALAGAVFAAAWLVRGGPLWWVSIMAMIAAAVRAVSWYRMGGTDTDEGALAASRATSASTGLGPVWVRLPFRPAALHAECAVEDPGVRYRAQPVPAPASRSQRTAPAPGPGTTLT